MIHRLYRRFQSHPRLALATLAAAGVVFISAAILLPEDALAVKMTMKRVIFEGPKRAEVLTLINNTAEETSYRLGWRTMRMTEADGLKEVPEGEDASDLKSASDMVIFAPRRVTVPPGGSQQIRLMLRKPKDLADGEYRAHLWVRPESEAVAFDPGPAPETGKASVKIKMLAGISMPVFVRHGTLTASATITDASAIRAGDKVQISFTLNRKGNRSIYGDADFICTGGGEEKILRQIRGIAIYPDIEKRLMKFTVATPPEGPAACSTINIRYTADKDDPIFKGNLIAEATASLR